MPSVRQLHSEAMSLAQQAFLAREKGSHKQAEELSKQAFRLESDAAEQLEREANAEPTRSVLYRSAASLAIQAKEFSEAQRLVAKGLAGYPPPEIEEELKDLYETINFEHHLQVRGEELNPEDFQVALQGDVVGSGTVLYSEFLKRLEHTKNILDRTIERLMGKEFRTAGRIARDFQPFTPAITIPRPGSFAISFKLVTPKDSQLSFLVTPETVINEIVESIDLLNNNDLDGLRQRIKDERYYSNFVSLARDMAPDGERINFVGFTSRTKKASLTKSKKELKTISFDKPMPVIKTTEKPIEVTGILDFAMARGENVIELTTIDGERYKIRISEGMDDLVRTYFGSQVVASGTFDGRYINLSDLSEPS